MSGLYGVLECKLCFEILLLMTMADMDCLFMWKAIECALLSAMFI